MAVRALRDLVALREVVELARLKAHAAHRRHVAAEALDGKPLEAPARGLVALEQPARQPRGELVALAGQPDDVGAQRGRALREVGLGARPLGVEALGGEARVALGALEAAQALARGAERELALLDALGERGQLLLEVANLAVGVLALVRGGLDLGGLLVLVREVLADVGDLELCVLALAHDARELGGDLLAGEVDGLEARPLRHGGEGGGALEQADVQVLQGKKGGGFCHVSYLLSAPPRTGAVGDDPK